MAYITVIEPAAAEGKLAELYQRVRAPNGQVDNVLQIHSLRPPVAAPAPLAPARRRQLLIRFARLGADRLRRGLLDPEDGLDGSA